MDYTDIKYFIDEETTIIFPKQDKTSTTFDITYLANQNSADFKLKFQRVSDKDISKASVGLQLMNGSSQNSNALIGVGVASALALGGVLICKKRKQTEKYVSDAKSEKADDDYQL